MMNVARFALLALAAAVSACAPRSAPPPPPPPVQAQPPRPVQPTPPPPPPAQDWRDRALTPGAWSYSSTGNVSTAAYTGSGASFSLSCDRARRQVTLSRSGTTSGNVMTVRTSSIARNLALSVEGQAQAAFASLAINDPLLDAIAFSRGRFSVEVPGAPAMIIPAWPEPARVVEDCRF